MLLVGATSQRKTGNERDHDGLRAKFCMRLIAGV
jgi:hypothetical protein